MSEGFIYGVPYHNERTKARQLCPRMWGRRASKTVPGDDWLSGGRIVSCVVIMPWKEKRKLSHLLYYRSNVCSSMDRSLVPKHGDSVSNQAVTTTPILYVDERWSLSKQQHSHNNLPRNIHLLSSRKVAMKERSTKRATVWSIVGVKTLHYRNRHISFFHFNNRLFLIF